MLRTKISKFGMATAGVAAGAILAISPVFAQGTAPTTPSNGSTLLADILAAAQAAGLTAGQTKELIEVAAEISAQNTPTTETESTAPETETEDVDEVETDDDTGAAAAATTNKEKEKDQVKATAPKSSEKSREEKGGDD